MTHRGQKSGFSRSNASEFVQISCEKCVFGFALLLFQPAERTKGDRAPRGCPRPVGCAWWLS